MDPSDLEMAIIEDRKRGGRPKCVIPVHLYSMPANLPAIMDVARAP